MIRTTALALALVLTGYSCTHVMGAEVVGSGTKVSTTRPLAAVTAIEASGAFRLEVTSGAAAQTVVVEGDDNIVPLFVTEMSGGTLSLHLPSGSFSPKVPLVVRVAAADVGRLDGSGAIDTSAAGLTGARFEARMSGACKLRARGAVETVAFHGSGANEFDAFDLTADTVDLSLTGASTAHVHAVKRLVVDSSGASTVRYRGQPEVKSSASGASSVDPD